MHRRSARSIWMPSMVAISMWLTGVAGCAATGEQRTAGNPPGNLQTGNAERSPSPADLTASGAMGNSQYGPGTPFNLIAPVGVTPQPGLPPEIASIRPLDRSDVCPTPQVALALRLTDAMRKKGTFDPSTVSLSLDGQSITQQSAILGTMDSPQSQVSITYKPKNALQAGMHQASFTYPSADGPKTLRWTFTVVSRPCP